MYNFIKQLIDIPKNAEIINITDDFDNGGPVVLSYFQKFTEDERFENRKRLDIAINDVLNSVEERIKLQN